MRALSLSTRDFIFWFAIGAIIGIYGAFYDGLATRWGSPVPTDCGGVSREELLQRWKQFPNQARTEIFGQHIAVDSVFRLIYAHLSEEKPSKSLVLSFHGWLGSGKTHLSSLVSKALFPNATVHYFIGPRDFLPDSDKLRENQMKLVSAIEDSAKACSRSLFIFDEIDKMPAEVFDSLTPYIDYHEGVYGKLIFIFLSNTGGESINRITFRRMAFDGGKRETLSLFDFREQLAREAFNEKGGLFRSDMISKSLVSHFIPFLPLQYEHLLSCARREIKLRNVLYIQPEQIVSKIPFSKREPKFAEEGCKNIGNMVNYFVHESEFAV